MRRIRKTQLLISIIFVIPLIIISLDQCSDINYLGYLIGIIVSAYISFSWSNDDNEKTFIKILLYGLRDLVVFMGLSIIIVLVISLFIPVYNCYTDRAKVTETLSFLSQYKTEINEYYEINKSIESSGTRISIRELQSIEYQEITKNGKIYVFSRKPASLIILIPNIKNENIEWTCKVFPAIVGPAACR